MLVVKLLCFIAVCILDISHASTHWMVTESGLIQPRPESPFEIARPYDLLSFLNQETHWEDIINLYHELSKRQMVISTLWSELDQDTDVGSQVLADKNCMSVGLLSTVDWYSSFLDDGSSKNIAHKEFLLDSPYYGQDKDVPDCKKISSLTFSMFAFEHLESVINRVNLSINAELALPTQIAPIMNADQYGHWVANVLKRNSSSWLHYNMASLYWRIRGNAPKAIECCRRALHYAPRQFKDIPLLSLGIILHRSRATEDAITVLSAAVDHDPNYYLNHFMLANAYAVHGDFNNSIEHIQTSVKINPTMDIAVKHKHAILCYANLLRQMDRIKANLVQLREDLRVYSEKEAHWLKAQGAFLKTMKHSEDFDYRNMEKNCQKMSKLTGFDIKTLQGHGDKNALIKYFLDGPMYKKEWLQVSGVHAIESLYNLQNLIRHIEKHASMASDFVIHPDPMKQRIVIDSSAKLDIISTVKAEKPDVKSFIDIPIGKDSRYGKDKKSDSQNDEVSEYESGFMMYPLTMKINRNNEDFDKDAEWPSDKLCLDNSADFPNNVEAIFPVFLPFENKGIRMKAMLSDKIGVPVSVEHNLPWHPPVCAPDKDAAGFVPKKNKPQVVAEVVDTGYLRSKLLEYAGDGSPAGAAHMQDAEIGHRIYVATQMNVAPKWMVLTLSSLYWRVRGNNINALHCLLSASRRVPARYKDVVLVSLASVYIEMGYFDEAMAAAEEAFRLSLYEPATNFLLAELNMLKKHRNTHLFHLKQTVRVEGRFMGGLGRRLLYAWGCILKQVYRTPDDESDDEGDYNICTQVEPGVNVVCEKNGDNCQVTSEQCTGEDLSDNEAGTLNRLMKDGKGLPSEVDKKFFQRFVDAMPADRSDVDGHNKNFAAMMEAIDAGLLGCGPKRCDGMSPEDLAMKKEDCSYHHLQLGYWLQVVSFKQLVTDSRLQFPAEVPMLIPSSNKQFPECKLPVDPSKDFYVERMLKVHSEKWLPTVSLMHQLAEMFEYFNYVMLGAKLAKYVETKPLSWAGVFAAGWWCGAGGRGRCAVRCLAAARALAPPAAAALPLRALSAMLHTQMKPHEAKEMAYLSLYTSPKNPFDAFVVGVAHTYLEEYEQAIWMFRYALEFDERFLPAKACLHAAMCLVFYGDDVKGDHDPRML